MSLNCEKASSLEKKFDALINDNESLNFELRNRVEEVGMWRSKYDNLEKEMEEKIHEISEDC